MRNKSEIPKKKGENGPIRRLEFICFLSWKFVSDFGFRISDFSGGFSPCSHLQKNLTPPSVVLPLPPHPCRTPFVQGALFESPDETFCRSLGRPVAPADGLDRDVRKHPRQPAAEGAAGAADVRV